MATESFERKKMTNVYILEILKRYTDDTYDKDGNPAHCLSQKQIMDKLRTDYGMEVDRKAVARGLLDLTSSLEYGEKISCDREYRKVGGQEGVEVRTNYRYCHDFDSAQLRFLIDAVLFSKSISTEECEDLLEKISKLGSVDVRPFWSKHARKVASISDDKVINNALLDNIDVIEEAIENKKQIFFIYNNYGKDKKLHPILDPEGNPLTRVVNPYELLISSGRYYLVCNYDEYDTATTMRVDRITDIQIQDTSVKSRRAVKGLKEGPLTLAEQLYMQAGYAETITFKATNNENIINDLVDWFGKSVTFGKEDEKTITCNIKANPKAIRYWAMQYSDHIEIITPKKLRDEIRESLRFAWRRYNDGKDTLIETDEEVKKLLAEWHTVCDGALKRKEEERKVDIAALGLLVKKTHSILLPMTGKRPEGQYAQLVLELKEIYNKTNTRVLSDAHCISLILESLIDNYSGRRGEKALPDDILQITYHTHINGTHTRNVVNIDINNFEEDYLTLKQFAHIEAEEERKAFAEMHAQMREKMREKREAEKQQQ